MRINDLVKMGLCGWFCLMSYSVQAFDVGTYKRLANDSIKQVSRGVVGDIDALLAVQEQLMSLGLEGGIEHLKGDPKGALALNLVIENAEDMKTLDLEEIEELWHDGGYLSSKGVNLDEIVHFSPTNNLMDAIIHPATTYILINEYKKTGNADLLARVKSELLEVIEHVKHVHDDGQVSSDR